MPPHRPTVFLPCHTLDDFPTWLDDQESDALLAAWVAVWHPWLIATTGSAPSWASVDLPAPGEPVVGIVPVPWDDRFAGQLDASVLDGSIYVRGQTGEEAMRQAVATGLGLELPPSSPFADDFAALGLGALLAELLARRMRSQADLSSTGFDAAVVAAARAAVEGRDQDARQGLQECFDTLSATRARYYPVDSYLLDLVLIAPTTTVAAMAATTVAATESGGSVAVVAEGGTLDALAVAQPEVLRCIREALAAGTMSPCGGRDDHRPIDATTPEQLMESFARGHRAWDVHLGMPPTCFARLGGGGSHLLPQMASFYGQTAGIWSSFDGRPLPDVGGGVISWAAGGAHLDMLASPPLDARSAAAVLRLPELLGDAMDRYHVAALAMASYAGTASRWHRLVRRLARRTNLLGTLVSPQELVQRTKDSATSVTLEPDAFPPTPPPTTAPDSLGSAVAEAEATARAIVEAAARFRRPDPTDPRASVGPEVAGVSVARPWWSRWFGRGKAPRDELVLEHGAIRVEAHAGTGGILSIRRPSDRGNRLSQQLAFRTATSPTMTSRMVADSVRRTRRPDGRESIVARGRLLGATNESVATFSQTLSLVSGMPIVELDLAISLERAFEGPLAESHVAARFAWHENEDVEIRRSLHLQSIATERTRFTAPHFVEVVPNGSRFSAGDDAVAILTGGLPWHMLSSPHVLDSFVAATVPGTVRRRMAIGLGLERPWEAAIALLAQGFSSGVVPGLPTNVRLAVRDVTMAEGRVVVARVAVVESAGRSGEVVIDWGRPVWRAEAVDSGGTPRPGSAIAIDGTETVLFLERFQWLAIDVEFTA